MKALRIFLLITMIFYPIKVNSTSFEDQAIKVLKRFDNIEDFNLTASFAPKAEQHFEDGSTHILDTILIEGINGQDRITIFLYSLNELENFPNEIDIYDIYTDKQTDLFVFSEQGFTASASLFSIRNNKNNRFSAWFLIPKAQNKQKPFGSIKIIENSSEKLVFNLQLKVEKFRISNSKPNFLKRFNCSPNKAYIIDKEFTVLKNN